MNSVPKRMNNSPRKRVFVASFDNERTPYGEKPIIGRMWAIGVEGSDWMSEFDGRNYPVEPVELSKNFGIH